MSRRGATEFAILGLLTVEPMSGYDLRKHFQESLIYFWNESYGQIYPTLKGLARQGLVASIKAEQTGKRDRQVYSLTSKGRERLREWLGLPPQPQPIRNEFLLKIFLGREARDGALGDHVRRLQAEHEKLLAMYLIIGDSVRREHAKSPNLKYWMLCLSHGIRMRRAEIEWCKEALRVVEGSSPNPEPQEGNVRARVRRPVARS
ncbi:MAG TPA: PadR family transcriptional regulator [Terriglobales bacterium]|nr:PadR family transcriptional regulator [Terriglobales bacterium]